MRGIKLIKEQKSDSISAMWRIAALPGLRLTRAHVPKDYSWPKTPGGKPGFYWEFFFECPGNDAIMPEEYETSYNIQVVLSGQVFPTRREALQSLEVVMLLAEEQRGR